MMDRMETYYHKDFASEEIAGSVIRSSVGLVCTVLLIGTPFLLGALAIGGFFGVCIVLGFMSIPVLGFTRGLKDGPGSQWFHQVTRCGCGCTCFMVAMIAFTLYIQFSAVPETERRLDDCCNDCTAYCSQHFSSLLAGEVCPDPGELPSGTTTSRCSVLPSLQKSEASTCSLAAVAVPNGQVPQCAESETTGCITPVMCHSVALACHATAEQNERLKRPKGEEKEGEDDAFEMGPCKKHEEWLEFDFSSRFALAYVIFIGGMLGCAVVTRDTRKMSRMEGVILIPVPPRHLTAIGVAQPPAVAMGTAIGAPATTSQAYDKESHPNLQADETAGGGNVQAALSDTRPSLDRQPSTAGDRWFARCPQMHNILFGLAQPPAVAMRTVIGAPATTSQAYDKESNLNLQADETAGGGNVQGALSDPQPSLDRQPSTAGNFARKNKFQMIMLVCAGINVCLVIVLAAILIPSVFGLW